MRKRLLLLQHPKYYFYGRRGRFIRNRSRPYRKKKVKCEERRLPHTVKDLFGRHK